MENMYTLERTHARARAPAHISAARIERNKKKKRSQKYGN